MVYYAIFGSLSMVAWIGGLDMILEKKMTYQQYLGAIILWVVVVGTAYVFSIQNN